MQKIFYNKITLTIITLLAIAFSFSLHQSSNKSQNSQNSINQLKADIAITDATIKNLEQSLAESDQKFNQEKIIRDELLMQKPGEYIVQIPKDALNAQQEIQHQQQEIRSPLQEWIELIF